MAAVPPPSNDSSPTETSVADPGKLVTQVAARTTVRYRASAHQDAQTVPLSDVLQPSGESSQRILSPRRRGGRGRLLVSRVDQQFRMRGFTVTHDLDEFLRAVARPNAWTWLSAIDLRRWSRDPSYSRVSLTVSTLTYQWGEADTTRPPPSADRLAEYLPGKTAIAMLARVRALVQSVGGQIEVDWFNSASGRRRNGPVAGVRVRVQSPSANRLSLERLRTQLAAEPCVTDVELQAQGRVVSLSHADWERSEFRFNLGCTQSDGAR